MDVIYAAEKPSIAKLLGDYVKLKIDPEDIDVTENPAETGSFLIDWRLRRYVLSPAGEIAADAARRTRLHAMAARRAHRR
jgi:hypothetical protein